MAKIASVLARLALVALVAAQLLAVGCSSGVSGQIEGETPEPEIAKTPVRVSTPVPVDATLSFVSNLYVERDVWVTPRSTGIIEKVLVDRGDRVRAGQELVVMETEIREVEVKIAEQRLRFHAAQYERSKTLLEQNMVSDLDALEDEIDRDLAVSDLELARAMLERCTVRAPFDGFVVERLAVPGQRVMEEDGVWLMRVVAEDGLRARINLPEGQVSGLSVGDEARIEVDGSPGVVHPARIVFVSPVVDAASDTALVIIEAVKRDPALRTGAAVRVGLADATNTPTLYRIPREALANQALVEGGQARILMAASGRAETREVDLVEFDGLHVTVRGPFRSDDLVIIGPTSRLSTGDPVSIRSD